MRLALLPVLMLALPLLSGCAGLVEEDPNAAAQALADAVAPYVDEAEAAAEELPGHIAGTVVDANATPIAGASVLLRSLNLTRTTDADGSFAFVDLHTGTYELEASADGFLAGRAAADVAPAIFVRPTLVLESEPAPLPYMEVFKFEGHADVAGPIDFSCHCRFEFALADGVEDLVLEAVLDGSSTPLSSDWMSWYLSTYDDLTEEGTSFSGEEASPVSVLLTAEELGSPSDGYLEVRPSGDLLPEVNRTFTAYVSAFYHGPAPADYTVLED